MQRVIVICEGETEREFCKTVLAPYFAEVEIFIHPPLIKKSMGGIVKWSELKKQILHHLKNEPGAIVTTLIDYYGLYEKYEFPAWDIAEATPDKNSRMEILEEGMKMDIDESVRHRYIPYVQLHEFEGLLFNDIRIFDQQFPARDIVDRTELEATFAAFENPEMINNSPETAPSKRLARIIAGYNKVIYGTILAESIGLANMKDKCPRFSEWLDKIENLQRTN